MGINLYICHHVKKVLSIDFNETLWFIAEDSLFRVGLESNSGYLDSWSGTSRCEIIQESKKL